MIFHDDDDDDDDKEKDKKDHEGHRMGGLIEKLMKTRTVLVTGTINQEVAEKTMAQLLALDADSTDPITVVISSPGGHVDSGLAIHDTMKFLNSPVRTIGAGWVASIAVPIFFGADKAGRYSLPNTRFLLHQPSGGAGGQVADIRIEAQEILKIREKINNMIARETGKPVEQVAKDSDRNFWMSAQEALDYGLVHKIIAEKAELGL